MLYLKIMSKIDNIEETWPLM